MININQKDAEKFIVDITKIKKKRSVQQKMVEFLLLNLFQKECIFCLIDILLNDMKND
jgi:hypothetical protein